MQSKNATYNLRENTSNLQPARGEWRKFQGLRAVTLQDVVLACRRAQLRRFWHHDDDDDGDGGGDDDDDDDFGVTGEMTLESQASRIWSHKRDIARQNARYIVRNNADKISKTDVEQECNI